MNSKLLAAALLTFAAFAQAQPGPGMHGKMMMAGPSNTPGWSLMTEAERKAHQEKMQTMKSRSDCMAYHDEHMKAMQARAKEQGKSFEPGKGMCDMMNPPPRRLRMSSNNTPGWSMMNAEERKAHRARMHDMKSMADCTAYRDEHMKAMEARAKEKGKTFTAPRHDACKMMEQRAMFKQ